MGEVLQTESALRFYEHDYGKPPLDDVFLEHHGILGMHWGQRNGPPYPLGSDVSTGKRLKGSGSGGIIARHKKKKLKKKRVKALKKARETKAQNKIEQERTKRTKEDIIKSKDIVAMYKHMDKFTDKEINDVLNRLGIEDRLRQEVEKKTSTKSKKAWKIAKGGVSKGLSSGTEDILSTITKNAMKKATRAGMQEIVGPELTDELLPMGGNKKKKKGN